MSARIQTKIEFGKLISLNAHLTELGLGKQRCVVISDTNVWPIYSSKFEAAMGEIEILPFIIPAGEGSKSPTQYWKLIDELLDLPIDRTTPIIAFGGGVVGDLSGFVSASIFRGVPFVQVPTTLIAQVDSAIGGKTGINHSSGKNLIGAFYAATLILIDIELLNTLPLREARNGLAEVIKAGFIKDEALIGYISSNRSSILALEEEAMSHIVQGAAQIKLDLVEDDEFESGLRAILNFGHTFGHAIENTLGYGEIGHGEAVGIGMMAALKLSEKIHPELDFSGEIKLVQELIAPRPIENLDAALMSKAFLRDKKRSHGRNRFILLNALGSAEIRSDIDQDLANECLKEVLDTISK